MLPRALLRLAGLAPMLAVAITVIPARALAPAATAPPSPLTSNTTSLLRGGEMGELLAVYVPRTELQVQRLLGDAREAERSAAGEIDATRKLATDADGRARIMREEIQATKVRWDVARTTGDAKAVQALDATYKRQVNERDYLEQVRDALRADADRLEADQVASAASIKALELELLVSRKNLDLSGPKPTPTAVTQYKQLLREMLGAQQDAATRGRDAADRQRLVAERRLRQLDTLNRLSAPAAAPAPASR
jgi:hypothetical protein